MYRRLTRGDRYQIERGLARNLSVSEIAADLGFHRTSVWREVKRNKIRSGHYSWRAATIKTLERFHYRFSEGYEPKKIRGWVGDQIVTCLNNGWSPEQISHRLMEDQKFSLSAEAIYKHILRCKREGSTLHRCLRRFGRRRSRFKKRTRYGAFAVRRRPLSQRPLEANLRSEPGHWERDLLLGCRGSGAIITHVERKTRYLKLAYIPVIEAEAVERKSAASLKKTPLPCITVTNDNGHEFSSFKLLEALTGAKVYFTTPMSPWQRGSVENANGLLRQYIPKGADLRLMPRAFLQQVESMLNQRPRKVLNWWSPDEVIRGKKIKRIKQRTLYFYENQNYEQPDHNIGNAVALDR